MTISPLQLRILSWTWRDRYAKLPMSLTISRLSPIKNESCPCAVEVFDKTVDSTLAAMAGVLEGSLETGLDTLAKLTSACRRSSIPLESVKVSCWYGKTYSYNKMRQYLNTHSFLPIEVSTSPPLTMAICWALNQSGTGTISARCSISSSTSSALS